MKKKAAVDMGMTIIHSHCNISYKHAKWESPDILNPVEHLFYEHKFLLNMFLPIREKRVADGLVAGIWCFHRRGRGSIPGQGTMRWCVR